MSKKPDNPHVSIHTCKAKHQAIDQRFMDMEKYFNEKYKSIAKTIGAVGATSTLIMVIATFILSIA